MIDTYLSYGNLTINYSPTHLCFCFEVALTPYGRWWWTSWTGGTTPHSMKAFPVATWSPVAATSRLETSSRVCSATTLTGTSAQTGRRWGSTSMLVGWRANGNLGRSWWSLLMRCCRGTMSTLWRCCRLFNGCKTQQSSLDFVTSRYANLHSSEYERYGTL